MTHGIEWHWGEFMRRCHWCGRLNRRDTPADITHMKREC